MSQKAPTPVVTHVEILARAIKSYDAEIASWTERSGSAFDISAIVAPLQKKRDAVAQIYALETGADY